jgi:hypothetical protein
MQQLTFAIILRSAGAPSVKNFSPAISEVYEDTFEGNVPGGCQVFKIPSVMNSTPIIVKQNSQQSVYCSETNDTANQSFGKPSYV